MLVREMGKDEKPALLPGRTPSGRGVPDVSVMRTTTVSSSVASVVAERIPHPVGAVEEIGIERAEPENISVSSSIAPPDTTVLVWEARFEVLVKESVKTLVTGGEKLVSVSDARRSIAKVALVVRFFVTVRYPGFGFTFCPTRA
jgi:hypothetical protein